MGFSRVFLKRATILNRAALGTAGFTLFELLIVLVIIGLVSALVLPKAGGNFSALKLKAETKKVATLLRYARSQAVSENMTVSVKYDKQGGVVTAETDSDSLKGDYPWEKSLSDEEDVKVVLYKLVIDEHIEISMTDVETEEPDGPKEIVFYPSGGSTGGEVFLKTGEKKQYRLLIDDISGTVKVLEHDENAVG